MAEKIIIQSYLTGPEQSAKSPAVNLLLPFITLHSTLIIDPSIYPLYFIYAPSSNVAIQSNIPFLKLPAYIFFIASYSLSFLFPPLIVPSDDKSNFISHPELVIRLSYYAPLNIFHVQVPASPPPIFTLADCV